MVTTITTPPSPSLISLYEELLLHIFNYFTLPQLLSLCGVCKDLHRIACDVSLWKCFEPPLFALMRTNKVVTSSNAKGEYLKLLKSASNMWKGRCSVTNFQNTVHPIVGVSREDNLLVACTANNVQVWDINKMILTNVIPDASGYEEDNNKRLTLLKRTKLVLGSKENSISIYNIGTKRMLGSLRGHTEKVVCANWDIPSLLYTGSRDHTARLWDTRSMSCARVFTLEDRVLSVATVAQEQYHLIVGCKSGFVSYYDIRKHTQPFKKVRVCSDDCEITGMRAYENFVYTAEQHAFIHKYDVHTHVSHVLTPPTVDVSHSVVSFNDHIAVAGSDEGKIYVWSLKSNKLEYSLEVARSFTPVMALMLDDSCIAYGTNTGVVGICNFLKPESEQVTLEGVASLSTHGAVWQVLRKKYDL